MSEAGDAMRVLNRAGRGEEAHKVVESAATAASQRYASIRNDDSRTDDYKREEIRRVYEGAKADVAKRLSGLAAHARQTERDDFSAVFGTNGLPGDEASLAISRRDAQDRVADIQNADELRALLRRATRSGDEVLARTIAERALENEDATTLNLFLDDRPHLDSVVQRIWDGARRERATGGLNNAMALAALRPEEMW